MTPTITAIGALMAADSSFSEVTRKQVLALLRGQPAQTGPHIVRRLEAARRLGVSPRTVDNFVKRGELRPVKLGRATGFTTEELDRYVGRGT